VPKELQGHQLQLAPVGLLIAVLTHGGGVDVNELENIAIGSV
jgi:hypothetical protein